MEKTVTGSEKSRRLFNPILGKRTPAHRREAEKSGGRAMVKIVVAERDER